MTTPHTDHPMRHFDRTCPGCAENEMTYQLPEPEYLGWDYERLLVKPIRGYTADQMQAAWQAGRESMRQECAAFVVRNAGVVQVASWERMIKELK